MAHALTTCARAQPNAGTPVANLTRSIVLNHLTGQKQWNETQLDQLLAIEDVPCSRGPQSLLLAADAADLSGAWKSQPLAATRLWKLPERDTLADRTLRDSGNLQARIPSGRERNNACAGSRDGRWQLQTDRAACAYSTTWKVHLAHPATTKRSSNNRSKSIPSFANSRRLPNSFARSCAYPRFPPWPSKGCKT